MIAYLGAGAEAVGASVAVEVAAPVLRHRVQLAPEVAMGGQSMDEVLKGIVESVPAPRQ